jgi:hypothetical protein
VYRSSRITLLRLCHIDGGEGYMEARVDSARPQGAGNQAADSTG